MQHFAGVGKFSRGGAVTAFLLIESNGRWGTTVHTRKARATEEKNDLVFFPMDIRGLADPAIAG